MTGYAIGSKAHYEFLKEKLINIGTILGSFELNEEEKKKRSAYQAGRLNEPNGEILL